MSENGFYVKMTSQQAEQIITQGISELFGGTPNKFLNYTYSIEDSQTGDLYWKVEDKIYDSKVYKIEEWLTNKYPSITKYTHEFVSQLTNEDE